MPLFKLSCPLCSKKKTTLANSWAQASKTCECGSEMSRSPSGLSSQTVERLDNGVMPKALERLADAERLYRDRADAADPLAGK